MMHAGGHGEIAARRPVRADDATTGLAFDIGLKCLRGEGPALSRVASCVPGPDPRGGQLRADDEAAGFVQCCDLVSDTGEMALGQGDESRAVNPESPTVRQLIYDGPFEGAAFHVQRAFELVDLRCLAGDRVLVDEQADGRAVRNRHDGLTCGGESVGQLGIGDRPGLVEAVEKGRRPVRRLPFVEGTTQSEVAVGQREESLGLFHRVGVVGTLNQPPGIRRVLRACGEDSFRGCLESVPSRAGAVDVVPRVDQELAQVGDHQVGSVGCQLVSVSGAINADDQTERARAPGFDSGDRVFDNDGALR